MDPFTVISFLLRHANRTTLRRLVLASKLTAVATPIFCARAAQVRAARVAVRDVRRADRRQRISEQQAERSARVARAVQAALDS
jgi:uncharacterized protein (DUF2384 family)